MTMARAKKRTPDVPFALRLPPLVYKRVKETAERQDDSMNAVLVKIVREFVEKESQPA